MHLFNFLTNPIIIVIIIGVISKMFKNQRSNQQSSRQPNPKLNPMHPSHFDKRSEKTNIEEVYERAKNDYTIKKVQTEYTNIQNQSNLSNRKKENSKEDYQIEKKDIIEFHKETTVIDPTLKKRKKINKANVVKGIVWSEVLGQPRAYKKWSSK